MFESLKKYFGRSKKQPPKKENSLEKFIYEIKSPSLEAEIYYKKYHKPLKIGTLYNIISCPPIMRYLPTPEPESVSKAAMFVEENMSFPNLVFYDMENNKYLKFSWLHIGQFIITEI